MDNSLIYYLFIGIQFYIDNSTHIKSTNYIKKDIIFPLMLRPIATLWLPAPRNVRMSLNALPKKYYFNLSIDEKYTHRDEKLLYKQRTVNCAQLHNVYPYSQRIYDNHYCHQHFM
jgi:hypothetical protein